MTKMRERRRRCSQCCEVVDSEKAVGAEQMTRPTGCEDIGRFVSLETGVDRDENASDGLCAESGDEPFGAVRRPDGDAVTVFESGGDEGPRRAIDGVGEFGERQTFVSGDQTFEIAETAGCVGDAAEGQRRGRHDERTAVITSSGRCATS